MRLFHHFGWQFLSLDASAILVVEHYQVFPNREVEMSFLTIPIMKSMQRNVQKKVHLFSKIQ